MVPPFPVISPQLPSKVPRPWKRAMEKSGPSLYVALPVGVGEGGDPALEVVGELAGRLDGQGLGDVFVHEAGSQLGLDGRVVAVLEVEVECCVGVAVSHEDLRMEGNPPAVTQPRCQRRRNGTNGPSGP
jgi:hypothetical protein